jgi:hypothetical protein
VTSRERTQLIDSLLEELEQLRHRINVSKAFGVRAAALRDLKSDFNSAQARLVTLDY